MWISQREYDRLTQDLQEARDENKRLLERLLAPPPQPVAEKVATPPINSTPERKDDARISQILKEGTGGTKWQREKRRLEQQARAEATLIEITPGAN